MYYGNYKTSKRNRADCFITELNKDLLAITLKAQSTIEKNW